MKSLNKLHVHDKCESCGLRDNDFFCGLSDEDLKQFESIKITKTFPKGANLFVEGQAVKGVYMLCQGKVKLSTCSTYGKIIILDVCEPGDILGLSAAINGSDYETTAQVLDDCQVNYVKTSDLLRFLQTHPQACLNAARQLGRNYQTAYRQICALGLSDSVSDKLAKLFLGWSRNGKCTNGHTNGNGNGNGNGHANGNGKVDSVHLKNFFTHEEMAEMIGASRETVTRALKFFRENDLITLRGSDLIIHDRKRLKAAIGTRMSKPREFGTSA